MTDSLFPVVRSILSAKDLLANVVDNYDVGQAVACHFLNPGLNDTYEVITSSGRSILRVYSAGWRTNDDIRYEFDVLNHLDGRGVPVSIPIAMKSGEYVQEFRAPEGVRQAALFTYAPGTGIERNELTAQCYGEAVGRVHKASADFSSPYERLAIDREHLIGSPLQSILPFLAHRPADQSYLKDFADRLSALLETLPIDRLKRGFCHGDFHGGNAHIAEDKSVMFFDFDCCGPGWLAYDLAVYRWSARRLDKEDLLWPAFLRGYERSRSLPELDLQATPIFVAARQLWWLGLNTALTDGEGRGWIDEKFWDKALKFLRDCEGAYFNS